MEVLYYGRNKQKAGGEGMNQSLESRMRVLEAERNRVTANLRYAIVRYELPKERLREARENHHRLCTEYRILQMQYIEKKKGDISGRDTRGEWLRRGWFRSFDGDIYSIYNCYYFYYNNSIGDKMVVRNILVYCVNYKTRFIGFVQGKTYDEVYKKVKNINKEYSLHGMGINI